MEAVRPGDVKPTYKGERAWRTSKEDVLSCFRCNRIASHVCDKHIFDGRETTVYKRYLCAYHVKRAVQHEDVRSVAELPEFRKYQRRLQEWKAAQKSPEAKALF